MVKTLSAVYEDGILKLTNPLALSEHQRVRVTVSDWADPAEPWLDREYLAAIDAMGEMEPALEEVRAALSGIKGNLSDAIREERDARG
jgi:predicted DNA-binding antitoxin AbrB/MazE fold protein